MADYQGLATGEMIDMLPTIIDKVLPVTVTGSASGDTIAEVGQTLTPSASFAVKQNGTDVAVSSISVKVGSNNADVTIASNKKSWTANSAISQTTTYRTTINGKYVDLTWTLTNYRYYGEVSSVPTDYPTAIRALANKALSTSKSLTASVGANKYYLFAVKNTGTLKAYAVVSGSNYEIGGCVTGTCAVQRQGSTTTDNYIYILVPSTSAAYSLKIE